MKISYRLILITFLVVIFITVTTNLIYYSTTNNILKKQQESNLNIAISKFNFFYNNFSDSLENELITYLNSSDNIENFPINKSPIDFLIQTDNYSLGNENKIISKEKIKERFKDPLSLKEIFENSPDLITHYYSYNDMLFLYGNVIDNKYLDEISDLIQAEVVYYFQDSIYAISNKEFNLNTIRDIKENVKSNFKRNWQENESEILIAKIDNTNIQENSNAKFAVFINSRELSEFRFFSTALLVILVVTSTLLSLIFILLFTSKLRTQISYLYNSAEEAAKGNLEKHVKIISKDELGKLGRAFNKMLNELKRKHEDEREYSEFLSLINQNPSLEKISEAVLNKILNHTKIKFGTIYLFEKNRLRILATAGINIQNKEIELNGIYKECFESKYYIENNYKEQKPVLVHGFNQISIDYKLVYPIVYNNSVIALIEVVSEKKPYINIVDYLIKLHDQLALGIVNTSAFERMSILVDQLKELNITYENQNKQIREQNTRLLDLHKELKVKAYELEKEKKNAEELTKVKSQFLAGMSHELKTPLTAILTLTDLVKKNLSSSDDSERLAVVHRNGKKLLSLINNILEFSKIESGKIELKSERFMISEIIHESVEQVNSLIGEKPIKINLSIEKEFELNSDKAKIEQILNNLLSNAVKYTNKGEINISISSTLDRILRIEVSDTGIGISETDQQLIFEEFKQINTNTQMKNKGSGLGLSICKKYVDLLNGFITLRSEINKGTAITVSIPNVILSHEFTNDSENYSAGSELKILIVDDDEDTLYSISEIIKTLGFSFQKAKNGVECLDILNEGYTPDLVLLDIMMPVKNGFDTIKDIRNTPKLMHLIVYAITAHAMLENKEIVERNGFNGIITKPIINENLEEVLIKIFQRR